MRRILLAYLSAVLLTYVLASVLATAVVLGGLTQLGVPMTLRDRLLALGHDIIALTPTCLPPLLLSLAAAYSLAALLAVRLRRFRGLPYALFAAVAVLSLHLGFAALFGFSALAGARENYALGLQGGAGWIGGYAFFIFRGLARR